MMKRKGFISFPVLLVLVMMGFVYYTTVFIFMKDWFGLKSSAGILNAFVFSCFALMGFVSFVSCVITDPGHVPSNFVPEIEDGELSDQGGKKNVSFHLSFHLFSFSNCFSS